MQSLAALLTLRPKSGGGGLAFRVAAAARLGFADGRSAALPAARTAFSRAIQAHRFQSRWLLPHHGPNALGILQQGRQSWISSAAPRRMKLLIVRSKTGAEREDARVVAVGIDSSRCCSRPSHRFHRCIVLTAILAIATGHRELSWLECDAAAAERSWCLQKRFRPYALTSQLESARSDQLSMRSDINTQRIYCNSFDAIECSRPAAEPFN